VFLFVFCLSRYPEVEDEVYMNFCWRRQVDGLKTTDMWLQSEMIRQLNIFKPQGYAEFQASPGWLSGFKKRYRICMRSRTNKKHIPIHERLVYIRQFHQELQQLRLSQPQRCQKYGRFPADCI
jgi:hypothetical protein